MVAAQYDVPQDKKSRLVKPIFSRQTALGHGRFQVIKPCLSGIALGIAFPIFNSVVAMDLLRLKTRIARARGAGATSSGSGAGELHAPQQSQAPHDSSSTHAINEGIQSAEPGTNAQDFGAPADQPTQQPVIEPPTSLESSIDAGQHVPKPTRASDPSSHVSYRYASGTRKRRVRC